MAEEALAALIASKEVRAHLAMPKTGVYIVRQDGHILWASPSMSDVTDRTAAELVGGNGWSIFVAPEDVQAVAQFKAHLASSDGMLWMKDRRLGNEPRWYRIDTWVRRDLILCAFRREKQPAEQYLHFVLRPRPRPA